MVGVTRGISRGKGVTRQQPCKSKKRRKPSLFSKRRKTQKTQKGRGIESAIFKSRVAAIPKGIKMLYNIAKGKPVSDRIKRLEGYDRKYAAYRNSGGRMTKLQWAKANHA